MRKRTVLLGLIILLITGLAGLNIIRPDHDLLRGRRNLPPDRGPWEIEQVFNRKEGWGFVRSRNGRTPEITAQQRKMVEQYNALFVGNVEKKQVTLTFDLGYEKETLTPKILKTLQEYQVRAAFFVTTHWLKTNPVLAQRLIREGHLLMNHTVRHQSLPTLSDEEVREEITGWEAVAVQTAGYHIKHRYMRPPMGEYSERTLKITKELGYRTAFWSVAIRDWLPMGGPGEAVKGIIGQLHNGAVILLHGNSEDSVHGLAEIISQIRARGYKIVPIYEI